MASGRVDIDTVRGTAKCERCAAIFESKDLGALLAFAQRHHACEGRQPPLPIVPEGDRG